MCLFLSVICFVFSCMDWCCTKGLDDNGKESKYSKVDEPDGINMVAADHHGDDDFDRMWMKMAVVWGRGWIR
eukprot:TRINITY_DN11287_c0_g1_i1.p2 TRINITY_DN11287_c0_g1~~TRINITY_DN11287_c0_g1_i1.p2  ORF type:complete len:72 (-),score=14.72 TRINITY_DN11287_c0_g1_i1:59-274(-)